MQLGVRSSGREREVTSAGDRIVDEIGERAVRTLPLGGSQPLVEGTDASSGCVNRTLPRSTSTTCSVSAELQSALLDARATELGDGEVARVQRRDESFARSADEAVEPGGHELLQPLGDGQRLCRISERASRTEGGAGELECVERMPPDASCSLRSVGRDTVAESRARSS